MHLVGFIIGIYQDAQSHERQSPAKHLTGSVVIHTFEFHGSPKAYSMHKQIYMVDSVGCSDFSATCTVSNCRVIMNNELRGMWKRTSMAYFVVLSQHLPVLTMGLHDKPQTGYTIRIICLYI